MISSISHIHTQKNPYSAKKQPAFGESTNTLPKIDSLKNQLEKNLWQTHPNYKQAKNTFREILEEYEKNNQYQDAARYCLTTHYLTERHPIIRKEAGIKFQTLLKNPAVDVPKLKYDISDSPSQYAYASIMAPKIEKDLKTLTIDVYGSKMGKIFNNGLQIPHGVITEQLRHPDEVSMAKGCSFDKEPLLADLDGVIFQEPYKLKHRRMYIKGSDINITCLQYVQSLLTNNKPKEAITALVKAWGSVIEKNEKGTIIANRYVKNLANIYNKINKTYHIVREDLPKSEKDDNEFAPNPRDMGDIDTLPEEVKKKLVIQKIVNRGPSMNDLINRRELRIQFDELREFAKKMRDSDEQGEKS